MQNFENFLKPKSLISQSFYSQFREVRGVLKLSGPQCSKTGMHFKGVKTSKTKWKKI